MRKIILRTADHHLVAAFECVMIDIFINGPKKSPPDVVFWGSRVFQFSTMDDDMVTYTEAFAFALIEGATAHHLPAEAMVKIPSVDPKPSERAA